jgi:hypothetical protein
MTPFFTIARVSGAMLAAGLSLMFVAVTGCTQTPEQQAAAARLAVDAQACSLAVASAVIAAPPGATDTQKGIIAATAAAATPACAAQTADAIATFARPATGPVPAAALK